MLRKVFPKKSVIPSNNLCTIHYEHIDFYCDNEECGMIMCKKCSAEHLQHADKKTSFPERMNPILAKYSFIRFLGKSSFSKMFEIEFESKKQSLKWVDFFDSAEENEDEQIKNDYIQEMHNVHQREIELLESFNCEFIIQISHHEWLTKTDLIIILDHVKMNLKAACASVKKTEHKHQKIKRWFHQICKAVQYFHKINLIHRNLKPQHIYVTEKDQILLSGFLNALEDSDQFFETQTEQFFGSPLFMAPEIKNNKVNPVFTKATDIWALGIIYHMMLAIDNPFKNNNLIISKNIRNQTDKSVIRQCLQLDPSKRIHIDKLTESLSLANQNEDQNLLSGDFSHISEFLPGNFVILEPLDGKEGKVFKAFDKHKKQFVALKSVEVETEYLYENLNEKENLKTIKKADENYLIGYWDTYIDSTKMKEGKFYLKHSLELGLADLNSLLELRENYTQNEIFFILKQLANSLAALCEKKICHGNICAENVVVFAEKNWFTYKFVDFGFSYKVSENENQDIKGLSDLYASPELKSICNDSMPNTKFDAYKADIYALGVLCLVMMGIKNDQVEGIQNDLSKLENNYLEYEKLKILIKDMLAKKSEDRCNIEKLKSALVNVETEPPIEHLYLYNIQTKNLENMDESVKYQHYTQVKDHEGTFSLGMNLVYVGNENNSFW